MCWDVYLCRSVISKKLHNIMLTRQQKEQIVEEVANAIKSGKSVTLVDYKGLGANDMVALKKSLYKSKAPLRIVKKSLLALAMKEAGVDKYERRMFDGQIAVSISAADEVAGPKAVAEFAKGNDNVKIVGGALGVTLLSADEMNALAKLPSEEQLRAQVVGALNAPISGFVNILSGNLRGLTTVLKAVADQKA